MNAPSIRPPPIDAHPSPPDDDALARALADCPRCLGSYLAALAAPGRVVTCDACQGAWSADAPPRARPVDVPADCEAIARWLPAIVGRAMSYGGAGGGAPRHGERPDALDARHRDARGGLRTAMRALSTLDLLERHGEARHVRVLWFAYVLNGPELIRKHKGGLEDLVAHRFAPPGEAARWAAQKSVRVRALQVATCGARLLSGARAAYEGTARGHVPAPRDAPAHRELARSLDQLLARTLARGARVASGGAGVANDGIEAASEIAPETAVASA